MSSEKPMQPTQRPNAASSSGKTTITAVRAQVSGRPAGA